LPAKSKSLKSERYRLRRRSVHPREHGLFSARGRQADLREPQDGPRDLLEHPIEVSLVIPTFYDGRNRKSREVLERLELHFGAKVTEPIRANVRLAEAASHHQTIFEYDPSSHGARDYKNLAERVLSEAPSTNGHRAQKAQVIAR
jgi:cellulose biosynthesis protein BcsQ